MSAATFCAALAEQVRSIEPWIKIVMVSGTVVAVAGTWLVARANARTDERIRQRRAQRRARLEAAEGVVDALSGRSGCEQGEPGDQDGPQT